MTTITDKTALPTLQSDLMTMTSCILHCQAFDEHFAAVHLSDCYCLFSSQLDELADKEREASYTMCNSSCGPSFHGQLCGGMHHMAVVDTSIDYSIFLSFCRNKILFFLGLTKTMPLKQPAADKIGKFTYFHFQKHENHNIW